MLSGFSAASLWGLDPRVPTRIEVSVPAPRQPRPRGVIVRRRASMRPSDVTRHRGIPVTSVVCTLVDISPRLSPEQRESVVNRADTDRLVTIPQLRAALDAIPKRPGAGILRAQLEPGRFRPTRSRLERRFLKLIRDARLPLPETRVSVNGYEVDFYWRDVGLVVETDGLTYHRTPAQQLQDRLRDQAHTTAGITQLRFPRVQVEEDPAAVAAVLVPVYRRLQGNV